MRDADQQHRRGALHDTACSAKAELRGGGLASRCRRWCPLQLLAHNEYRRQVVHAQYPAEKQRGAAGAPSHGTACRATEAVAALSRRLPC